jgi:hypothetical protein
MPFTAFAVTGQRRCRFPRVCCKVAGQSQQSTIEDGVDQTLTLPSVA